VRRHLFGVAIGLALFRRKTADVGALAQADDVDGLAAALMRGESVNETAAALARLDGGLPRLAHAVREGERKKVRSAAAMAIGNMDASAETVDAIAGALGARDAGTIGMCTNAFKAWGHPRAIGHLRRSEASRALDPVQRSLFKQAYGALLDRDRLLAQLGDGDPVIRAGAAEGLGALGAIGSGPDGTIVGALRERAAEDPVPGVRVEATAAMNEWGAELSEVMDLLWRLSDADDLDVAETAIAGLIAGEDPRAGEAGARLLARPEPERAVFGAAAIVKSGDAAGLERLRSRIASCDDDELRGELEHVLAAAEAEKQPGEVGGRRCG
jgi:hypothetical protein